MAILGLFIFWCIVELMIYSVVECFKKPQIIPLLTIDNTKKDRKNMSAAEVLLFYKNKEKNSINNNKK